MIEPINGQIYRPRPMYNGVNIEIHLPPNMTNAQMTPPHIEYRENEGEYACPRCGYYDIPKVSIYNHEHKSEEIKNSINNTVNENVIVYPQQNSHQINNEKHERHHVSDRVIIYPQQTIIERKNLNTKTQESTENQADLTKVTNPISNVKPKTIEVLKPDANILQDQKVNSKESSQKISENIKTVNSVKQNDKTESAETKKTEEEKPVENAKPKTIEIVKPNDLKPTIDINTIIAELASPDFARQADAMGTISQVSAVAPDIASHILDPKVIDTLLGIMTRDTNNLAAPTQRQMMLREAMVKGHNLTPQERTEATVKAPVERAEQNKAYAMYTIASMQKVFNAEVEKIGGKVELRDLPGAKEIINEVETNLNPQVKIAGLSALNYVQKPEYKADLQAIYQKASQDENPMVRDVAQKALNLLK